MAEGTLSIPPPSATDAPDDRKQHDNVPHMRTTMKLSGDGKYFIHKVEIVTIKPVKYVEVILQGRDN